jgi:hypothetical protein
VNAVIPNSHLDRLYSLLTWRKEYNEGKTKHGYYEDWLKENGK